MRGGVEGQTGGKAAESLSRMLEEGVGRVCTSRL